MSDANSNQTLMALLALDADDSVASDNAVTPADADKTPPLPTLDQRTDMFLRAVHGPGHPIKTELRAAARERLLGAMAADLADEGAEPALASVDSAEFHVQSDASAGQLVPSFTVGLSRLWGSLLQYGQGLSASSEVFTLRGLRMAAVPLVALLIAGSVWTTAWINQEGYSPANQNVGPSETSPIGRSRGLNNQPNNSQTEQDLRRDIAATEATFGRDHPALAPKLVDLAGLLYSEGQYAEAEALCSRALTISQRVLGPRDSETVRTVKQLAMIYRAQGRSKEADELLARVGQP
jgi:tetratricopeptide (TPR) repeat protein